MGIKFEDFAEIIGVEIELRRFPLQNGRWMCQFKNTEVKGKGVLIGVHGNDTTPDGAMAAYAREIEGTTIVVGAYTGQRKEFNVPNKLETFL